MAPDRQIHYSLNFPKSSTPSSTTSSNKSVSDSSSGALELSIVGLPAPRSRTSNNNAAPNNRPPRTLKSAPIKNTLRDKPPGTDKRGDRPWASKRNLLKNAWSLETKTEPPAASRKTVQRMEENSISLTAKGVKISKSVSTSSATISFGSVSASSAGDVSSLDDDSNSQYSQAKSENSESKSEKFASARKPHDKFSFPVPARVLKSKLKTSFEFEEDLLEKEFESCDLSERNEADCLAKMQEQVLELVENQQACSRQTWLVMQQLSATLDTLTKKSQLSEQKSQQFFSAPAPPAMPTGGLPRALPGHLLMKEAAGCAIRLADILALIGSSVSPQKHSQERPVQNLTQAVPPLKLFPASPADLQSQKEKLKPTPLRMEPKGEGLMEQLNATLKLRRASIYQSDPDQDSTLSEDWRE